jgi:poly(A) polymerase
VVEKRSRDFANESTLPPQDTLLLAMNEAIDQQIKTIAIPRRFTSDVREIWLLQDRLPRRSGKRAERLFAHPRFRAAFDFLELRSRIDGRLKELVQWWAEYQQANAGQRGELASHPPAVAYGSPTDEEPSERAKPRRRRRRSPRRPKEGAA